MTPLKDLAAIALKISRTTLQKTKGATPVIILGFADGSTKQLYFPEPLYGMLDNGPLKDVLFDAIREAVQRQGAASVVIAMECWIGRSTEAGRAMPEEEFRRLGAEHKFETLVQMGMLIREEAVVATAQSAESMVACTQSFRRLGDGTVYSFSEIETVEVPQDQFYGRTKMFGELCAENLR